MTIRSDVDGYPIGPSVSDKEPQSLYLKPYKFHGEWHYTLTPEILAG